MCVCVYVCVCVCVCVFCVCLTDIPIKAEVEWPKLNLEVTFICEMIRKRTIMINNSVTCGYIPNVKTAVVCGPGREVTSFLMM